MLRIVHTVEQVGSKYLGQWDSNETSSALAQEPGGCRISLSDDTRTIYNYYGIGGIREELAVPSLRRATLLKKQFVGVIGRLEVLGSLSHPGPVLY